MPTHAPTLSETVQSCSNSVAKTVNTRDSLYRDCLLQGTQLQLQVYLEKKIRVGTYFKIDKVNKIIIFLSFTLLYNEYAFV